MADKLSYEDKVGLVDLRNNNIDAGSCSINSLTNGVLTENDVVEVYVFGTGGGVALYSSVSFNIERIGNV